jgi:hypothetical protein
MKKLVEETGIATDFHGVQIRQMFLQNIWSVARSTVMYAMSQRDIW